MVPIILMETREGFLEASRHKRMERIWICENDRGEGESQAKGTAAERNSGFIEGPVKEECSGFPPSVFSGQQGLQS